MKVRGLKPGPPPSLCTYFKREYFKNKSKFTSKKKSVWDATAMWCKLSCEERDKFRVRFQESNCRREREYACYLGTLEPYLKKKVEDVELEPVAKSCNREGVEETHVDDTSVNEYADCSGPIVSSTGRIPGVDDDLIQHESLEYPAPPPRDAKELFMMTHEELMNRAQCEDIWRIMPRAQKARYWTAVKWLKKHFLEKYKTYLMSLSSFQLAQHCKEKNIVLQS